MRRRLWHLGWIIPILAACGGCAAPRILGKASLVEANGVPQPAPAPGVTVNFVNLSGTLEESVVSAQTDEKGKYSSPELPPGEYTVEAMFPGFVIEKQTVVLKKHGAKKAEFVLKKIRESKGRSVRESEKENIPTPGEVKITPPPE